MRLHICAVGRLRTGPEHSLIQDYQARTDMTGRAQSLGPLSIHEIDERKARTMPVQGEHLAKAIPDGAFICLLDERGKNLSSPEFATFLTKQRDQGYRDLAFVIGGADGLDPTLKQKSQSLLSLGKMVWPHMLARAMLCEQIYRATTILAGTPYHRV